jgi:hypothetical protein
VLLTGIARSGTSWLGAALGRTSGVRYVFEPDNVDADPGHQDDAGRRGFGPYPVIDRDERNVAFETLWDLVFAGALPPRRGFGLAVARGLLRLPPSLRNPLMQRAARLLASARRERLRRLVKTIYAPFAIEWLVARYRPIVVVLQRNPLNVVSSWRELRIPAFDLTSRPAILERHVRPRGLTAPADDASELTRIAWCVGMLSTALGDAVVRNPEWVVATHEDLCTDPPRAIRDLAVRLGLTWTADAARFLADANRPGEGLTPMRVTRDQPQRWRSRLSPSEVDEVSGVLSRFPSRGWVCEPGTFQTPVIHDTGTR